MHLKRQYFTVNVFFGSEIYISGHFMGLVSKNTEAYRVEVSQIISAEQGCFTDLSFLSTDSEDMKNISADQLFQSWSALIFSESALIFSESALFQRKWALNQRWFLALKIFVFSAVPSWISAVQRFSGNEQLWMTAETFPTQSWSALIVSETSTRAVVKHED